MRDRTRSLDEMLCAWWNVFSMPAMPPAQLARTVLEALQESAASAILTSGPRSQPRRYVFVTQEGTRSLWVYIWTLTPGGRPQLPYELRVQMTGVPSPLPMNPDGFTVLLGYEPGMRVFAGFDLRRHRRFTPGSPSVQVDRRALQEALQRGLSFTRKETGEIVVGIRPDQMIAYIGNAPLFHKQGRSAHMANLMSRVSSLERIPEPQMRRLPKERKRLIHTISQISRDAYFRGQVLNAYGHQCAVTRIQLKLQDAAHILPVGAPGSTDDVTNGLPLAPTYHRAFDRGLIFLDEKYVMRINVQKEKELVGLGLGGGLALFRASLGKIHLPADPRLRPDLDMIRRGNRYRGIHLE